MLHTINPEILLLKQEDVIKAGLLDMKQILAVTEKTYAMLGQGLIKNPPKTNTSIPDKENWQSFFNAMPCYIGGDINIGGIKWAAESKKNATIPGIPYGIDISILSDPETVLPFCILDGTLITAMRTSAVGGLMAKYAAPSDADTACLVGAGVIGRTMISAVHEALPQIKTMCLCDIDVAKAEGIAKEYGDSLGVEALLSSAVQFSCLAPWSRWLLVCILPSQEVSPNGGLSSRRPRPLRCILAPTVPFAWGSFAPFLLGRHLAVFRPLRYPPHSILGHDSIIRPRFHTEPPP